MKEWTEIHFGTGIKSLLWVIAVPNRNKINPFCYEISQQTHMQHRGHFSKELLLEQQSISNLIGIEIPLKPPVTILCTCTSTE